MTAACKSIELADERRLLPPNGQAVSVTLMTVYIAKFFWWERWYMHAADIQVDRLGFMMCWGPICFMPLVHTLQNLFMVRHGTPFANFTTVPHAFSFHAAEPMGLRVIYIPAFNGLVCA